ncbi:MAG: hypothetical protein NT150_01430 [Bacteroidetes bacterium]|nr:hypothetical protein [Bacteroidota bacterium]
MENDENNFVLQFIPSLILLLKAAENKKGSALTEDEVLEIRDNALCIRVPINAANDVEKGRGYVDIDPENCWLEWQEIRNEL